MAQKTIISLKSYFQTLENLADAQVNLKRATQNFTVSKIENVQNLNFLAERVIYLDDLADRLYGYLTDAQIKRLEKKHN